MEEERAAKGTGGSKTGEVDIASGLQMGRSIRDEGGGGGSGGRHRLCPRTNTLIHLQRCVLAA